MRNSFRILSLALVALTGCRSGGLVQSDKSETPIYLPVVPAESEAASRRPSAKEPKETPAVGQSETSRQILQVAAIQGAPEAQVSTGHQVNRGAASSVGQFSLEQAISTASAQNPELVTVRQTERVSSSALGVAQTYPFNPFVQFQATPYQQAGGSTDHYILLMQTIQLAHQQQFREQSAACALNSTRWNIHQAELLTVAATSRLFFSSLYLRELVDLAEASDRNNRQVLRITEKQLSAGETTAADVAIVRADAQSTRQQLLLAKANYLASLRDLARQMGMTPVDLPAVAGTLSSVQWRSSAAATINPGADEGSAIQSAAADARTTVLGMAGSRPDVMAARSDANVARANLCLASASKTPDLQFGPFYQSNSDSMAFVGFRGQLDLPVINTGEPLERQRAAEHRQRVTAWQQALRRAELDALAAYERYETALAAINVESASAAMDLGAELAGLEAQFQAGEVDVIRVVQARSSLIQSRRARLDLLNEVAQSAAALTGAAGIPVEQLLIAN